MGLRTKVRNFCANDAGHVFPSSVMQEMAGRPSSRYVSRGRCLPEKVAGGGADISEYEEG